MQPYQYSVLGIIPPDIWKLPKRASTHENLEILFPRLCAANIYTPLLIQNSQIFVVTLFDNMDLTPSCLFMYDIAVLLSVISLRCFTATCSGSREKIENFIVLSSNAFICNLVFPSVHLPFVVWCLSCAPQPLVLTSLYVV